jgi:co-chaperonin GroES (HSP10)
VGTFTWSGYDTLSVYEKEALMDRIAQDLYRANRMFTPMFPWVFVRVLSKEQVTAAGVIMPQKNSKPIHEGIVLATWEKHTAVQRGVLVERESSLHQGSHVLFPHWAGLPIVGYSEERYRVVREVEWSPDKEGGIFATVDYNDDTVQDKLSQLIKHETERAGSEEAAALAIMQQFLLLDRDQRSVTLSGR